MGTTMGATEGNAVRLRIQEAYMQVNKKLSDQHPYRVIIAAALMVWDVVDQDMASRIRYVHLLVNFRS